MATETEDKLAGARSQAKAQYDSIAEYVWLLRAADDDDAYQEMAKGLAQAAGFDVRRNRAGQYYWAKVKTEGNTRSAGDEGRYDDEEAAWLACCDDNGLRPDADEARQAIQEDALSVQVRSGWYTPTEEKPAPEEFEILLCTGGPAVRIIGELDEHNQPSRARLECQDWFTPWTEAMAGVDRDTLLDFCNCFYFGD